MQSEIANFGEKIFEKGVQSKRLGGVK